MRNPVVPTLCSFRRRDIARAEKSLLKMFLTGVQCRLRSSSVSQIYHPISRLQGGSYRVSFRFSKFLKLVFLKTQFVLSFLYRPSRCALRPPDTSAALRRAGRRPASSPCQSRAAAKLWSSSNTQREPLRRGWSRRRMRRANSAAATASSRRASHPDGSGGAKRPRGRMRAQEREGNFPGCKTLKSHKTRTQSRPSQFIEIPTREADDGLRGNRRLRAGRLSRPPAERRGRAPSWRRRTLLRRMRAGEG